MEKCQTQHYIGRIEQKTVETDRILLYSINDRGTIDQIVHNSPQNACTLSLN